MEIELNDAARSLPLTEGVWKDCPEVCRPLLREWIEKHHGLDLERGKSPVFRLVPLSGNRFPSVP